ncbi:MAG TPA: PEP/pyruvate-binding domain-containing protein [Candidatus Limnocylindrales bacterium]|nr:PEP/pyruvate-binding domain-containing protein [Candidatus Limnocylindrales bacterium]
MSTTLSLVRSVDSIRASDAATAGGKGANLGELVAAGFAVPDGFVLTTQAFALAVGTARIDPSEPEDAADRLRSHDVPRAIATAALEAYRALGGGAVAVRSSATAEDLPDASFAGQQDTYLGVTGDEALLDAIRRCWASLWSERAVAYRRDQHIDDAGLGLAVVVQRMVEARAAGVLFTADPITGRRGRAVIDAAPGLGNTVVAGSIDPDHYTADPKSGEILERRVRGDKAVLTDVQVRELAAAGTRIERQFGSPQDIEFAFDGDGRLWIVQSRPITTLFPLPERPAGDESAPRVYFCASVAQGYFEPITPMGQEPFRRIGEALAAAFARGRRGGGPIRSPVVEAGGRLFVDVTPALRDPLGREVMMRLTAVGEARSSVVLRRLALDPRFALRTGSRLGSVRRIVPLLARSRIPLYALRLLLSPDKVRVRYIREIERATRIDPPATATSSARLDAVEELMRSGPPFLFPRLLGLVVAGSLTYLVAGRLLRGRATEAELQTLTRGLPHNPTTEMDLALWALATDIRSDPASRSALLGRSAPELAAAYRGSTLPPRLQDGLAAFLTRYGFRSVGEIDLGVARWSEDPSHLLGAIANYLQLEEETHAPDQQFERGAREAEQMVATLLGRVRGPRRWMLRFLLGRVRALMGSRELPKYTLIRRLFTPIREILQPVGQELAASGRLASPDDIYFLTQAEARRAIDGADLRETVAMRRATHARELARRHLPRILLSDGTDAEIALIDVPKGALRGSPASPGSVTATARVILSPHDARLEPGEILVAPSTDPGWTPLFLTAGGLVMEMGGMMSHGAVVAREYGIPAVVGVAGATERIATGDKVTVDGSAGVVSGDRL